MMHPFFITHWLVWYDI